MIVDDNEEDILLFDRRLREAGIPLELKAFGESLLAVEFLTNALSQETPRQLALPLVCFLDLEIPRLDGLEVLEWIREHRGFDSMAVIVLSVSDEAEDIRRAAELGAQCYFRKHPVAPALRDVIVAAEQHAGQPLACVKFRLPANLFFRGP